MYQETIFDLYLLIIKWQFYYNGYSICNGVVITNIFSLALIERQISTMSTKDALDLLLDYFSSIDKVNLFI